MGWVCGVSGRRGVMDLLAMMSTGVGRHGQEMDSETRIRPYGATQNFTLQETVMREPSTITMWQLFLTINRFWDKAGKTGASHRGNTGSSSGRHFYWA